LIEVHNIHVIDEYDSRMKGLGYLPKGEFGIKGRRFFLKGEVQRTHHVHAFQWGALEIDQHLGFRDYMIAHLHDAERYVVLKKKLAEQYRYDIDGYCQGKDAFIKDIDQKAMMWKLRNLW
jgi:GrpB-like predicted nucleotidyltransferase (UPF0157 family)